MVKRIWGFLSSAGNFARAVARDYSRDHGSLIAAAVSFYAFVSLIPLILLSIAVVGWVLGSVEDARASVVSILARSSPSVRQAAGDTVLAVVGQVVARKAEFGGISLLLLAWTGSSVANALCRAVNLAWGVEARRGLLAQRLLDIAVVVGVVVLLGVSAGITAAIEVLRHIRLQVFGLSAPGIPFFWQVMGYLAPLLVTLAAFTLIYKVLPNVQVPLRVAAVGAFFAGILWEAAKTAFGLYVAHSARSATVYGSLWGVILLQLWINVSMVITILGAEVASEWQKTCSCRKPARRVEQSQSGPA